MERIVVELLKVLCMLRFHQYEPWDESVETSILDTRDCVRCGTREYRDKDGNRVESRWVAGRENVKTQK
jgi:hypothetical protein